MESNFKYIYHLVTWGGFYNEEYRKIHNEKAGDFFFDTEEERQVYIDKLKQIEEDLGAFRLMAFTTEGFPQMYEKKVTLHRITEYRGKQYKTSREMFYDTTHEDAKYALDWKWYPGCNDYPLGEDFDYETAADNGELKTFEWIEGTFYND